MTIHSIESLPRMSLILVAVPSAKAVRSFMWNMLPERPAHRFGPRPAPAGQKSAFRDLLWSDAAGPVRPYPLSMTTPAGLGYRRPLPASTVSGPGPDPVRLFGRTTRDWVVDVLFFLLAICFTVLSLVDSLEQHIAPVPLAVDLVLGGLSCLGVWLRRRWPVGLAVIVGLFSIYSM